MEVQINPFFTNAEQDSDPLSTRILESVEQILSSPKPDSSHDKLIMVVGILEKVIEEDRLTQLRKNATSPLNILKVALHLSKKELRRVGGQDRLATRLKELIRMDGQYVTKRETVDSIVQLLEIHYMFGKKMTPEKKKVRFS